MSKTDISQFLKPIAPLETPKPKSSYAPTVAKPLLRVKTIQEQAKPPKIVPVLPKLKPLAVPQVASTIAAHATAPVTIGAQPLTPSGLLDASGAPMVLDEDQYHALELFEAGHNLVITGEAGSGKSTSVQALGLLYLQLYPDSLTSYRIRGTRDYVPSPRMAVVAFTNKATNSIRAKMHQNEVLASAFVSNVTTIHNLLEYTVSFEIDEETGKTKRRYYPQRTRYNKLDLDVCVIEEASTVGVGPASLWQQLFDALPATCKLVFLGDISQLPPVIGKSVLAYALQDPALKLVTLRTIHRQALDNPIIKGAHACLRGNPVESDFNAETLTGVRVFSGKSKIKMSIYRFEERVLEVLFHYRKLGLYDPATDMILSPYNKINERGVSAQNLSAGIATRLAKEGGKKVYEIRAGFQTVYLSVGDRVVYEKEEGTVISIGRNNKYMGKSPRQASTRLNYFGTYDHDTDHLLDEDQDSDDKYASVDIDTFLEEDTDSREERRRSASHIVEILLENGDTATCSQVGEFAELMLGYALSVHKAQGSEWPRVYVALHQSNNTLLFRELLYTAMTRPRLFLGIIAQPDVLQKTIDNQRIKGNSIEAKIEFFNGGYLDQKVDIIPQDEPTEEETV